jgi:peptidoglycan/LPS O-acetylase OafA/YrhL
MKKSNKLDKEDLKKLDVWRGALALLITIVHSTQLYHPKNLVNEKGQQLLDIVGYSGVLGFFFLSGMVIVLSLEKNYERNGKLDFKEYFIARFARIYPPLIFSILFCVVIKYIVVFGGFIHMKDNYMFSYRDLIDFLLMIKVSLGNVNAPLWTLILEWWFYFIGFFIYLILKQKKILSKILTAIIVVYLTTLMYKLNDNAANYLIIWVLGAVYGYFINSNVFRKVMTYISLALFVFFIFIYNSVLTHVDLSKSLYLQLLLTILFAGVSLKIPYINFFSSSAKYSYSLYILHYPFFLFISTITYNFVQDNMLINLGVYFISLVLLYVLSYFVSIYFENKNYYANLINKYF